MAQYEQEKEISLQRCDIQRRQDFSLSHQMGEKFSSSAPVRTNGRSTPTIISIDGDVCPSKEEVKSISYNDQDYKIQLARPAIVREEPLYANNSPELYAISSQYLFPSEDSSALTDVVNISCMPQLLSQADIALSKKAEGIIEQLKEDEKIAKNLQDELNSQLGDEEYKDFQYAKHLHEKEVAKLQRAKQRAKLKKQTVASSCHDAEVNKMVLKNVDLERKDSEIPVTRTALTFDEEDDAEKKKLLAVGKHLKYGFDDTKGECNHNLPESEVIPPYMPMQKTSNKKFVLLEKKLARIKEKEGCKQQ